MIQQWFNTPCNMLCTMCVKSIREVPCWPLKLPLADKGSWQHWPYPFRLSMFFQTCNAQCDPYYLIRDSFRSILCVSLALIETTSRQRYQSRQGNPSKWRQRNGFIRLGFRALKHFEKRLMNCLSWSLVRSWRFL